MSQIPKNPITAPDYEEIAASYDHRYRQREQTGIRTLLLDRMAEVGAGRWLEVGCGTGQWLLQSPAELSLLGLDQSRSMLEVAAEKVKATPLVQASALAVPFADQAFKGIGVVHAIHHFPDQDRFLLEAERVLDRGGGLLVIGMDAFDPDMDWYMYDFFEGVAERDRARFPNFDLLAERLQAIGFSRTQRGTAHLVEEDLIGEQVLDQPFLRRRGCSQMALLSDEAYQEGIERIKGKIAQNPSFEFKAYVSLDYLWAVKG
jgi:ubiquinone/menaquinone biosynthesis C-methylase UbiE